MRYLLLLLLLIGCGGGGSSAPAISSKADFGWWGQGLYSNNALAEAPGSLALIQGQTPEQVMSLAAQAKALGKRPVVMLWALLWSGPGPLLPDWQARADAIKGIDAWWYVDDEPGLNGHTLDDVGKVASYLGGKTLLSLSPGELDKLPQIPASITTLGVNLYAAQGDTPASAQRALDKLSNYGRELYLNLDAMSFRDSSGCITSPDLQRSSIALNEAILSWGRGRSTIYIAFRWQADGNVCGAKDLPIIRNYILSLQ